MEDLQLVNGNRPEEIHTIIAWDGNKDYEKLKNIVKIYHQILKYYLRKKIMLSKDEEIKLAQSIYFGRKSRKKWLLIFNNCKR